MKNKFFKNEKAGDVTGFFTTHKTNANFQERRYQSSRGTNFFELL